MKVQGVWASSISTCHGSTAIIGPKVPLAHHGGGGTLVIARGSSLPHAEGLNSRFSARRSCVL